MSAPKDGGPAFPMPAGPYVEQERGPIHWQEGGMSLRDYFAGQALTLFPLDRENVEQLQRGDYPNHRVVARFCYNLADAMLAEQERTP